jgi:outer membrane lipoprotein carrier protein
MLRKRNEMRILLAAAVMLSLAAVTACAGELTLDGVLDAHCAAREGLVSLRASFTQTKVFTLFDDEEEASGDFAFLRPGRIKWSFTSPDSTVTVMDGQSAWTVMPHIRQVQKVRLGGSSTDRIMSIIGFGSCGAEMREDFEITLKGQEGGLILLEMIPVSEDISPYFSLIVLGLDPGDHLPRRIVFREHSGDLMAFEFRDMAPGADVDAVEFEFSVPDGYVLTEY